MIIYIGADHRGFALKGKLIEVLKAGGWEVVDVGAKELDPGDDFPDYASLVAAKVSETPDHVHGIVICGSGFGVDIVANKFKGVRSALSTSPDQAYQGRHDSDANVLALPASFVDEETAVKIMKVFLSTPFGTDERCARRLGKIKAIESGSGQ